MADPPALTRWDAAAAASVLAVLALAYVVMPRPAVQYGAWLVVFSVWMLWFVAFGVRWLYGEDRQPEGAGPRESE